MSPLKLISNLIQSSLVSIINFFLASFSFLASSFALSKVNDKTVDDEYRWREGDRLVHVAHRHEAAVSAAPLRRLQATGQILAIDKPPSIPVHPGWYFNNIFFLIQKKSSKNRYMFLYFLNDSKTKQKT